MSRTGRSALQRKQETVVTLIDHQPATDSHPPRPRLDAGHRHRGEADGRDEVHYVQTRAATVIERIGQSIRLLKNVIGSKAGRSKRSSASITAHKRTRSTAAVVDTRDADTERRFTW